MQEEFAFEWDCSEVAQACLNTANQLRVGGRISRSIALNEYGTRGGHVGLGGHPLPGNVILKFGQPRDERLVVKAVACGIGVGRFKTILSVNQGGIALGQAVVADSGSLVTWP